MNTLNEQQKYFYDSIVSFVYQKKTGLVLLNAPAGTGKTYTITLLFQSLQQKIPLHILAPTHKAKSLFPPQMKAKTIHCFIGARPYFREEDGKLLFHEYKGCELCGAEVDQTDMYQHVLECTTISKERKEQVKKIEYSVVIVDETSMLDVDMLSFFKTYALHSLVIFTGDNAQIPPIDLEMSPIFQYKHFIDTFSFTEQMRSKTDVVRVVCDKFRNAVYSGNKHIHTTKCVEQDVIQSFQKGEDVVSLNWTNAQKDAYNRRIRKALFTSELEILQDYYVGEKLVFSGYKNTQKERENIDAKNPNSYLYCIRKLMEQQVDTIYHTNDPVVIQELSSISVDIPFYTCIHKLHKCEKCKMNLPKKRKSVLSIELHRIVDSRETVFYRVKPHSLKHFKDILKYYKDFILTLPKKERKTHWYNYYTLDKICNADLDYAYAITVHKAQGSQWDKVYVNIDNIRRCWSQGTRLAYTAVSRAKHEIYFTHECGY